jgi:hypothetical protein
MLTVICNRGKNPRTQEEMSDEITLNFWGKYADFAANYLTVGREINVDGELRSHRHPTGQINPATGKSVIERRVEVLVTKCFFGKDSMKEMSARVNAKIAALKQIGRIPMESNITADELLAVTRPAAVEYNPAIHDAAGMYGNAKIWKKGQGFVGNGVVAPQPVAQPVNTGNPQDVTALTQELATLKAQLAAKEAAQVAGATTEENPFVPTA